MSFLAASGVEEYVRKGITAQKALDAELRARIDALALTIHPMMAMDATRMPRGAKSRYVQVRLS